MNLSGNHVIPLFRWLGKPFFYSTVIWSITNYNGDCTNCIVAYFGSKLCHLLFILHQKSNCIYLMQDRPTMNIAGRWHDSIEIIKKDFEQQQQATVVPISSKVACPTLSSQVVFYSHPIVVLLIIWGAVIANVQNRIQGGGDQRGDQQVNDQSPMMRELTKRHWFRSEKMCKPLWQECVCVEKLPKSKAYATTECNAQSWN